MGSNPTPSARFVDIIEHFGIFGSYAQSGVQYIFDDAEPFAFIGFVLVLAIIFSRALTSRKVHLREQAAFDTREQ